MNFGHFKLNFSKIIYWVIILEYRWLCPQPGLWSAEAYNLKDVFIKNREYNNFKWFSLELKAKDTKIQEYI